MMEMIQMNVNEISLSVIFACLLIIFTGLLHEENDFHR